MTIGPRSYTPLPPDIISVDAAGAAYAEPPVTASPKVAIPTTIIDEINLFT